MNYAQHSDDVDWYSQYISYNTHYTFANNMIHTLWWYMYYLC